jgi:hypothetical protein
VAAAEHVAACTGASLEQVPQSCDLAAAHEVLTASCDDLAALAKADGVEDGDGKGWLCRIFGISCPQPEPDPPQSTSAIQGYVVYPSAEPAYNAHVRARGVYGSVGGETDTSGYFIIHPSDLGLYTVSAISSDNRYCSKWNSTATAEDGKIVTISPNPLRLQPCQ